MHPLVCSIMIAIGLTAAGSGESPDAAELDSVVAADTAPWQPLPASGVVPPLSDITPLESQRPRSDDLDQRARSRQYEQQLRSIHHRYLKPMRSDTLRAEGLDQLREFTDPAAFEPMIEVLRDADDEIRLAMLDHLAEQDEPGQVALAFVALTDDGAAIVHEATDKIVRPPPPGVVSLIETALRGSDEDQITAAASLAGALNLVETIPLLIFAQAAARPRNPQAEGDLAWIAIETQRAYVQGLTPVAGTGAAGFAPVLGTVSEGSVLRIPDAVVVVYRTVVHRVLVTMTTADFGESTADLEYNLEAWWQWYNDQYVPHKNDQAALEDMAAAPE